MKIKKPENSERHFDTKDPTFCVYEVYRKSKKTVYYIRGGQAAHLGSITLDGFEGIPAGLYLNKSGFGFGRKGVFLLSALKKDLSGGKIFDFTISDKQKKEYSKRGAQNFYYTSNN